MPKVADKFDQDKFEFDRAIEEAISLFNSQEEEREKEKTTKEDERYKAEDVRLVALETARESMKRRAEAGVETSRIRHVILTRYPLSLIITVASLHVMFTCISD